MNQIRHIQKLNEEELKSGTTASWHDQYKDSAYVNVGGLPINLTEGDVITIFSQYGEVVDINMPRDANTGKPRGFAWLMYADQTSTVLAVDNLNGAQVLGRTLRVDHVLNYKQLERDQETGKLKEREEQSFAAHPEKFLKKAGESDGSESDSSHGSIDPDDPMRDYLISQRREGKKKRKLEGGESKDEKRRRKEERRRIREDRERRKAGRRDGGGGGGGEGDSRRTRAIEGNLEAGRLSARDGDLDRRRNRDVEDERDRRGDRPAGRDDRSQSPDRSHRRRGDSHDDARRDRRRDDDRRRSARDVDERGDDGRSRRDYDDRRGVSSGGGGGSDAFADLERWARGGK
ncbi:hypothetical protein BMF94_0630 [Rhodotorula taiwanensis]|uniref:RRM domain-containing protein n=1 Tax=Rhodotorula taiwanensis TaxID=741276 RepID=A0A2S5BI32_9BASI|nr:hypothetical protein BMF94_0630 [Rhodotorula taiwanensis]